jgi:hypothetical protein
LSQPLEDLRLSALVRERVHAARPASSGAAHETVEAPPRLIVIFTGQLFQHETSPV